MMEQKAVLFGDKETHQQILDCKKPDQIQKHGRKTRGFDQALWDKFKYPIVLNENWCKFIQNKKLRDFLISTGDSILAEASPCDGILGIQLPKKSPDAKNPLKWPG